METPGEAQLEGFISGERSSHSLYFEAKYNWTGLLVEPNMLELRYKNRKAAVVPTCLATQDRPHYAEFEMTSVLHIDRQKPFILIDDLKAMGGIVQVNISSNSLSNSQSKEKTNTSQSLQCIPLYTLLLAMNNPTVNWFILDIEGAEYQVLQTIPWHLVDIEMVSVETDLAGLVMPGSRQEIIDYMKSQDYRHMSEIHPYRKVFKLCVAGCTAPSAPWGR